MVGTIGYQVLGALWYGPVFGSVWMDAMGYEGSEHVDAEASTTGYVLTTVGSLVAATALAVLLDWVGATTWQMGLTVGLIAGVGFVATAGLQTVPFESRPRRIYVLNVGYNGVALGGIGVVVVVL